VSKQGDRNPADLLCRFKSIDVNAKTVYIKKGSRRGWLREVVGKDHRQLFAGPRHG